MTISHIYLLLPPPPPPLSLHLPGSAPSCRWPWRGSDPSANTCQTLPTGTPAEPPSHPRASSQSLSSSAARSMTSASDGCSRTPTELGDGCGHQYQCSTRTLDILNSGCSRTVNKNEGGVWTSMQYSTKAMDILKLRPILVFKIELDNC